MAENIVIAGAGHAAGQTAISLRQGGFDGNITLVGEEPYAPYQRPPLSKKFLAGAIDIQQLYLRQEQFYRDQRIELQLSTRIDTICRPERRLLLSDGTERAYDRLIIATGSHVRTIDLPGHDLPGVHYLRTVDDVQSLRRAFRPGRRLVIVGGGYIGLEAAAVGVGMGLNVTVLETAERVMSRVVAPQVSEFFSDIHRQAGVDLRCGTSAVRFSGSGHIETVVCSDGEELDADLVIIGVGVLPTVDIAEAAGLACDNGIVVDEYCLTEDPCILAVGDCTNHPNGLLGRRLRLESVHNAQEQAKTAAAAILGKPAPYAQVPWFWSDQYDLKLQIAGLSDGHDRTVIRGEPARRSFAAFYLCEDRLIAVDAVNSPREFMLSKRLIAQGARIDPDILADTGIPFKDLAQAALA